MEYKEAEIYRNGEHYDLINKFEFDIPFFEKIAAACGSDVLELACGTGRVSIPLAAKGFNVTGVDSSEKMLEWAKEKTKKSKAPPNWVLADMTQCNLARQFDLILCVHNSFSHLATLEEATGFFSTVKDHLKPGGKFILQIHMPDLELLNRNPEEQYPLISYPSPDKPVNIEVLESNYYEEDTQMNYIKWHILEEGEQVDVQHFAIRVYFPVELDNLVQLMGFKIESKFGDFEETLFNEYPDTQLYVLTMQ